MTAYIKGLSDDDLYKLFELLVEEMNKRKGKQA
nr:MAG TPA: hypothetical protein [Caudoviricetes sp.]